jgi:hypothetical protein
MSSIKNSQGSKMPEFGSEIKNSENKDLEITESKI